MDLETLIRGLTAGSIYALCGVSINILYRATKVFNFAQGDLIMIASCTCAMLVVDLSVPFYVAALAAVLLVVVITVLIDLVAVAPILAKSQDSHGWVISTLAVALILENLVGNLFGPDPRPLSAPPPLSTQMFEIGGVQVSSYQIGIIVFAVLFIGLAEVSYKTRIGKAVLAIAEDREAARLRGIDPRRLARYSFACCGAVAAITGILAAPLWYASLALGTTLLLKGFLVALTGGIGSNRGSAAAGYAIGLVEAFTAASLSPGFQDAATFAILLLILLLRPNGVFGTPVARAV
jgi:branched-chain amino acid transport system permease protein